MINDHLRMDENKVLILFDGVCNLCNKSVQYIIKHDKTNQFLFAPLQGVAGKQIIAKYGIDTNKIDSIIVYDAGSQTVKFKSNAALFVASKMNFPFTLTRLFYMVPTFIRNWIYDFIAQNRYRWFGKNSTCMVPTPELESKFLK